MLAVISNYEEKFMASCEVPDIRYAAEGDDRVELFDATINYLVEKFGPLDEVLFVAGDVVVDSCVLGEQSFR